MDSRSQVEELNVHIEEKVEAAMEETEAINSNLCETNAEIENARRIADRDMKIAVNVRGGFLGIEGMKGML